MKLLHSKIRRELPISFDRKQWIVELEGWGVSFRAKRTRKSYPITWNSIWNKAMEIAAERERQERAARRKKGNA